MARGRKPAPQASVHLEIQSHGANPYGILRTTERDENGKIVHKTVGRFPPGMSLEDLKLIQAALQGKVSLSAEGKSVSQSVEVLDSKEYGASAAFYELAKSVGLDRIIYSKTTEPWVRGALAMIIGRIVYPGSKLSLSKRVGYSELWNICGVNEKEVDVDKYCYEAMDRLLSRQGKIQKALAQSHDLGNCFMYDITSSYVEGSYEDSELVSFGYNRDKKKGHAQIVIGLVCSGDGCPICVEVFPGKTNDAQTVEGILRKLVETYEIKHMIFVGDRGMLTDKVLETVNAIENFNGIQTITALRHKELEKVLNYAEENGISISKDGVTEIHIEGDPDTRYISSFSAARELDEEKTRKELLGKTSEALTKIAASHEKKMAAAQRKYERELKTLEEAKEQALAQATSDEQTILSEFNEKRIALDTALAQKKKEITGKTGERVGKVTTKWKSMKFIIRSYDENKLVWKIDEEKLENEKKLDGFYCLKTQIPAEELSPEEALDDYRALSKVEQSFRTMKSSAMDLRPIWHQLDDRIRGHVFIMMLAYYLLWTALQRLSPMLEQDGEGQNRKYTIDYIIEALKGIRMETISIQGVVIRKMTKPNEEQQRILDLLGVKLKEI